MTRSGKRRKCPEVCMNSACAGAEDGITELHTVAVREKKQYRDRAKASLLRTGAERAGRAGPRTVEGGEETFLPLFGSVQ